MADPRATVSICANCLSHLRLSAPSASHRASSHRSFHITSANQNVVKKKQVSQLGSKTYSHRERRSAKIKKDKRVIPPIPAIGERKAMRKRIVLSNTNALPVTSMQDLSAENMTDIHLQSKILGLPGEVLDQLRAVEAFKPSQNWSMFRRPGTLIRQESTRIGNMLKEVNESKGDQKPALRAILDGPKLGGKSLLLLQAMAMAFLNKWVVVNIPEAQELTIAHSSYKPVSSSPEGEQLYRQPGLTTDLLKRIALGNSKVLSQFTLAHQHPDFPTPLQKNMSLDRLARRGFETPSEATKVFAALWKELTAPAPNQPRPPVLISIDGFNHIMTDSAYRAADFSLIHAHQFTLIRHFLGLLFGKKDVSFGPAGGVILAATSGSNSPGNYTLDISLKQLAARTQKPPVSTDSPDFPLPEPYQKLDKRVLEMFNEKSNPAVSRGDLQLHQVNGLQKAEAKGLLEYFAQSGLLREKITDDLVAEKWSMSGGGLVGFVERAAGRVRV